MTKLTKAKLVLEDGTIYEGYSFGSPNSTSGEVVFNTGMVGYPECFTDPSYKGQILTLTYPLIGNYGVPGDEKDKHGLLKFFESNKIHIQALIVSEYSDNYSHWNAKKSLAQWLKEHKIPAIQGIDTRALTKQLREKGAMLGKIIIDKNISDSDLYDPNKENLVDTVSIKEKTIYGTGKKRILLIDCGVKNNIIRCFLKRDCTVIRVPWNHNITNEEYDGLFISNGPGDPTMCTSTISNLKTAIIQNTPIFGICLGNQLLALASGAKTYKLKYGHRAQNQPCIKAGTKSCYITSQNHGFAVDDKSLKEDWEVFFTNANDNTNEGIKHKTKPIMSVQFHPEATAGPVDTEFLFDEFLKMIK